MPWKVVPRDGKFDVVQTDSGAVVDTHDSEEEAIAHQRALYANYNPKKAVAAFLDVMERIRDR